MSTKTLVGTPDPDPQQPPVSWNMTYSSGTNYIQWVWNGWGWQSTS